MARTIHALGLVLAVVSNIVTASTTPGATSMRSLLGFNPVQIAPAPAPASGASQAGFVPNSYPTTEYPLPGRHSPLNFTIEINKYVATPNDLNDPYAKPEEPPHCQYFLCDITVATGCPDSGGGPLVINVPPSSYAQVNFSVPASSNASVINLIRPENGTITAYQPSPGGEPQELIDQIYYDQGNGTAVGSNFTGSANFNRGDLSYLRHRYPIPGSMSDMEALESVSFITQKNATIGYTIPLVVGLATNATEYDFEYPSCYININFVVKDGPANLAPGTSPVLG